MRTRQFHDSNFCCASCRFFSFDKLMCPEPDDQQGVESIYRKSQTKHTGFFFFVLILLHNSTLRQLNRIRKSLKRATFYSNEACQYLVCALRYGDSKILVSSTPQFGMPFAPAESKRSKPRTSPSIAYIPSLKMKPFWPS